MICASVNEQVVHGIPNRRPLREGDIVFDRHRLQGQRLVRRRRGDPGHRHGPARGPETARRHLRDPQPGHPRHGPLPDLVGGRQPDGALRQEPGPLRRREVRRPRHRPDDARGAAGPQFREQGAAKKYDIKLEPGIVLAIEPMVALGTKEVRTLADGWTVETKDRRSSATSSTPSP